MNAGQLRTILADCGDGLPITLDGRPALLAQVQGEGDQRVLNLITAADTTPGRTEPTPELAEPTLPVEDVPPADTPDPAE